MRVFFGNTFTRPQTSIKRFLDFWALSDNLQFGMNIFMITRFSLLENELTVRFKICSYSIEILKEQVWIFKYFAHINVYLPWPDLVSPGTRYLHIANKILWRSTKHIKIRIKSSPNTLSFILLSAEQERKMSKDMQKIVLFIEPSSVACFNNKNYQLNT